ncbi:hypothetical protein PPSIR1_11465 [Plesiocystis pacifica SIR-1]|uniref:PDZ domain-containing protein n=1 Tax=Plesiocystis pacifica SIR-1 TaxID=391625 RepID=A6G196_9BACT|nr:carboxypeptidase regulatory-like domain-containing protein [Plesiocystis pacifica]EDM80391.1 hypothetical protein PPSIR1_11465 [Plesiocystis pacifica SIR-1]
MTERNSSTMKWAVIGGIVLAVVIAAALLWKQRGSEGPEDADEEVAQTVDPAEALRRKRALRSSADGLDFEAPASIGGRVTRADDGEGIEGAVVLLSRKGVFRGQAPEAGEPSQPLMVVTDANGGWQLDAVLPGRYLLSATADGFLPGQRADVQVFGPKAKDAARTFDLALRAGGNPISGTISDIDGGPIEGVLVQIQEAGGANFGFRQVPLAVISDEEGRYSVSVANGRYAMSTLHADYVGDVRLTEVLDAARTEDFRLVPGGTIEGVVLARAEGAEGGKPVAGARVTFADSRMGGMGGFTTNISLDGSVVVTDDAGRFRLRGLRSGVVKISAAAAGYATTSPVEVAVGIGEPVSGVELWVDRAYTLSGFVVPDGDPEGAIEGVLVGAWQLQPPALLVATAPTSSDGYFEILGVPTGTFQVGAVGEENLLTLTGATAVVQDSDITDLLIELDTGVRIRGRVEPPRQARIALRPNPEEASLGNLGGMMADGMAWAIADENGEFELGPLTPGGGLSGGRPLTLTAESDDGYKGELEVKLGGEDLEGVTVAMEKGATVAGTVLDSTGAPQAGVTVSVTPADPEGPGDIQMNFGGPETGAAPTGEDGRYSVRGLDPGKHLVIVKDSKGRAMSWAPGAGPEPKGSGEDEEVQPLELNIEDTVNDTFLELRVSPRDGLIEGQVVDADGVPVPDAFVTAALDVSSDAFMAAMRPGQEETETVEGVTPEKERADRRDWTQSAYFAEPPVLTDENGFFVITELRRDRAYNLVAEGERGGARATQDGVSPGVGVGTRVTLTLETLGGLDGKVLAKGKAVPKYTVALSGSVSRTTRVNDPSGEFSFDRLDPGKYEIVVTADGGSATTLVELGESSRERVELQLDAWGSLEGELINAADGEALRGMAVLMTTESNASRGQGGMGLLTGQGPKTGYDGRFVIDEVPPGKGTLTFMDPDIDLGSAAAVAVVDFELEPGETLDLGTVKGTQTESVPRDERGDLGMRVTTATWDERPRPPGTDLEASDEEPDPEPAEPGKPAPVRLWVRSIDVGGAAEDAGVVPGDEVLTIDGESVASLGAGTAAQKLSNSRVRAGQSVRLELRRDGERLDLSVKARAKDEKKGAAEAAPEGEQG